MAPLPACQVAQGRALASTSKWRAGRAGRARKNVTDVFPDFAHTGEKVPFLAQKLTYVRLTNFTYKRKLFAAPA